MRMCLEKQSLCSGRARNWCYQLLLRGKAGVVEASVLRGAIRCTEELGRCARCFSVAVATLFGSSCTYEAEVSVKKQKYGRGNGKLSGSGKLTGSGRRLRCSRLSQLAAFIAPVLLFRALAPLPPSTKDGGGAATLSRRGTAGAHSLVATRFLVVRSD